MTRDRFKRKSRALAARLDRTLRYRESSDTLLLVGSALLIGALAGLGVVAFSYIVQLTGTGFGLLRQQLGGLWGAIVAVAIPTLGGLLITPIVIDWAPDVRGSGIPTVMLSVSNFAGRLPKRLILWRPIASAVSLGTGAALGSEGPVVQLSAAIASLTSNLLRLNDERRRNLVAVAAAGGIAATFNAPIAGVLFALEVILGRFTNKYFGSVVIGAVAASVVSRSFLGPAPAFRVPDYGLGNPLELPLYFLLGLLAAFVAVGVIRTMVGVENLLNALNPPAWLRPALGGLAIGLLGLLLPQVLGRGYDITGGIVQGDIQGVGLLLALCAAKILAMNISLGAWHSGGIFAPLLFIGAAFGAAVGEGFAVVFPDLGIVPGAFALVGMAAVFAGAERAPMSTIVLVFEMSGDYRLILPLLLAAVVATLVADIFHPESIYHVMLSRKGLSLLKQRGSDLLQTVTVGEVMDKKVPTLYIDDTIEDMEDAVSNSPRRGFVLVKRGEPSRLEGIATLSDLARARRAGAPPETPLADIATRTVACALPDEPVGEALERMALRGISRMPVVAARDRLRPVGYVTQSHLARGYYQALQRERTLELSEEVRRLRELTGQEIVEVRLRAASPMVGKTLRDAALPKESIVVAIRRHGRTVFPHGETRFEVGDVVVANVAPGFSHDFRARFAGQPAAPPNEDADAPKETER